MTGSWTKTLPRKLKQTESRKPARWKRYQLFVEALEDRLAPAWFTFAADPQHTGLSTVASQPINQINWQTRVDETLPSGPAFVHYGAPVFTAASNVIIPVRVTSNTYKVTARDSATGTLLWSINSDYVQPGVSSWLPPYGPTLTPGNRLYFAGNGGTIYYVDNPDTPGATITGQLAFYGLANYQANAAAYNSSIFINTPITADNNGNIYFGFQVTGTNPLGINSGGVARIDANGNGTYALAPNIVPGGGMTRTPLSSSPSLSNDGNTLYVALNNTSQVGYLVALNSTTLATQSFVRLKDPRNTNDANLSNFSTSTPTVAPDGSVFFGVLGNPFNGSRGFMLHYSADLATQYAPGAFGWDVTPSIIPASLVPSYHGTSSFLLFTKYNNYAFANPTAGNGQNALAILDPYATQPDPHNDGAPSLQVMREVIKVVGPTPDAAIVGTYPNAVREWCINNTAIDPFTKSALCNSEDGNFYRWDFATNTLTEVINITVGFGAPYTPSAIAPDGRIFVINGGSIFSIGGLQNYTLTQSSSLNPAAVGQSVTFTATLASTNNGATPTGTVTFKEGASVLAANVPLVNGVASFTTAFAAAGSHFITAEYSGDGTYTAGSTTLVESVRTYSTSVALSSGNLVISDATLSGKADNITIQSDTANNRFVISDPLSSFAVLGSIPGAVVSGDQHSVTVPFASVTGTQIIVNGLSGNDRLTVNFSLGNFAKTITFNGGTQNTASGDSLVLTGGGTFANVTHAFTDNFNGSVSVSGSSLITYNDLEPITDNLTATARNFNYNGGTETITITDAGSGRTLIDSTLGESVNFLNATTSALVNAGSGNDTVNLVSNAGVGLTVDGGAGTDSLNATLTGVSNGRMDLNGLNLGAVSGAGLATFNFQSFEAVTASGADLELAVNLNATVAGGFNGVAGFDGVADTTIFRLDATGQNLNALFNSQAALNLNVNAIRSLSIFGSQDADTVRLEEVGGRLITEGTQTAIGNGNFGGTATSSHLNTAMQTFLVANTQPTNTQVHFNGGPGAALDRLTLVTTTKRNARYFADTLDTIKSGNINVSQSYAGIITSTQMSAMRVSFASLTPIDFDGAGGTVTTDASSIARSGDVMTVRDEPGRLGRGFSQVVSTNRFFETTNVRGFDALELRGGKGSLARLASLDPHTSLQQVMLNGRLRTVGSATPPSNPLPISALPPIAGPALATPVQPAPVMVSVPSQPSLAEAYVRPALLPLTDSGVSSSATKASTLVLERSVAALLPDLA